MRPASLDNSGLPMHIHFLRHATFILNMGGVSLLVDPMFSPARAMDPVPNAANQSRIPMVELPISEVELNDRLRQIAGVLVTHTHRDHWDTRATELLPKGLPILCQPEDEARIREAGFASVIPIQREHTWQGVQFYRTSGQHGTGEIGRRMGPVSGFVLRTEREPTLYIAGDTVWCPEVADALQRHTPDVVIVNAGAAAFLTGGPITMTAEDVAEVCRQCPSARVIAVHMEVVNHCGLTRDGLRQSVTQAGLAEQVLIPPDGAGLTF